MRFSSKNLAAFYYQLGTLVKAGLPIQSALASVRNTAPRPMRAVVGALSTVVNGGRPLHEAMEAWVKQFCQLDRYAIAMSERSGALDAGLLSLSKYYEQRTTARSKLIAGLVYPVLMLTVAVFVSHFPELFLGSRGGKPYTMLNYLWDTAGLLARLALAGWGIVFLLRRALRLPGLNLLVDRCLRRVPIFGRLRFDYALSQWISSIRLMLRAGIGIVPALEYASRTVDSPSIAAAYEKTAPLIGGELEVSEALAVTAVFPDELIQFWATGERSGHMDEMLEKLAGFYEERWRRSLDQAVTWLPRIAYGLVVLYVVSQIFSTFGSIMNTYDEFLK